MEFQLPIPISTLQQGIRYQDKLLLTGSCFTEHIGDRLGELKFDILQNPHGILFDPWSVTQSLVSYIQAREYDASQLIYLNELWQSWEHHSRFSGMEQEAVLKGINASQQQAHQFLKQTRWLVITLGSSFSYRLSAVAEAAGMGKEGKPVANCHRAPANWFHKHLMTIEETQSVLDNCLHQLFQFNPSVEVLFTISPVRHIRDGVVENNRSKARLIEVVHHLANKFDRIHYFPAYELVIDVLRDYRFYDIDLVHPNFAATRYVMEKFMEHFVDKETQAITEEVQQLVTARKHKPFQSATEAHKKFLAAHAVKATALLGKYPFLDLKEEIGYFTAAAGTKA